jgi:PAS domain S-box-containing protein
LSQFGINDIPDESDFICVSHKIVRPTSDIHRTAMSQTPSPLAQIGAEASTRMALALRYLQHAVTQSHDAVFLTDPAGIISRVNPAFERLTGHSSIQAVGKDLSVLIKDGPQSEEYRRLWAQVFSHRSFRGDLKFVSRSGENLPVEMTATPVLDNHGRTMGLVCNFALQNDCAVPAPPGNDSAAATELTYPVGKLANELCQILIPALANAELALESFTEESPMRARLRLIKSRVRLATELVRPWADQQSASPAVETGKDSTQRLESGPAGESKNRESGSGAAVLVIEAEAAARESMTEQLSKCGYTVRAARSMEEALVIARASAVDLVITELEPNMTGQELTTRFTAVNPDIKILFVSGYASTATLWRDVPGLNRAFLQKPFSLIALAEKVGHVLSPPERPRAAAASAG